MRKVLAVAPAPAPVAPTLPLADVNTIFQGAFANVSSAITANLPLVLGVALGLFAIFLLVRIVVRKVRAY
jgi:hypothetical protein